jgi:hypothetical protein
MDPAVAELDTAELEAHVVVAEAVLNRLALQTGSTFLEPPYTTAANLAQARAAITLQVNLQVENGTDAFAYKRLVQGGRQWEYAGLAVHPLAEQIVTGLIPEDADTQTDPWAGVVTLTSIRGPRQG